MKPIPATFLMCALLMPSLLTTAWLHWHRIEVRAMVKASLLEQLPKHELLLLKIHRHHLAPTFRWLDEGEFEMGGQRFDVVRKHITGDTLLLWAWPDHIETGLSRQLDRLLRPNADPLQQAHHLELFEFFKTLAMPTAHALQAWLPFFKKTKYPIICPALAGLEPRPPVPPPEMRLVHPHS